MPEWIKWVFDGIGTEIVEPQQNLPQWNTSYLKRSLLLRKYIYSYEKIKSNAGINAYRRMGALQPRARKKAPLLL